MGNVNISESHILVFEWTAAAAATYQDFNSRPTLQIENRGKSKQEEFFFQSCDRQQKQKKSPTHAYTKSRKTTVSRKNNREKSKPPLSEKKYISANDRNVVKKIQHSFFSIRPEGPKNHHYWEARKFATGQSQENKVKKICFSTFCPYPWRLKTEHHYCLYKTDTLISTHLMTLLIRKSSNIYLLYWLIDLIDLIYLIIFLLISRNFAAALTWLYN